MLRVLSDASESLPELKQLSLAQHVLNNFRRQTTLSDIEKIVEDIDRVSLLKLLCDQIVSSIGIAHLMRLDIEGALQEVASANLKMLGKDGRPVFTVAVGFSQRPTLSRADFAPFIAMPEKES